MNKIELGYGVFVTNLDAEGPNGFHIPEQRHLPSLTMSGGVCLDQDYYVGLGVTAGGLIPSYRILDHIGDAWLHVAGFVDFDYRPLDRVLSPMAYARAGAAYNAVYNGGDQSQLSPYAEVGLGFNWYYAYRIVNMERNYRSLYLTVGAAYQHFTVFLPIRLGIRF